MWKFVVAGLLIGYFMGAIPVGYLVGLAFGKDVRRHGSGRTGGTNVWRAAGVPAAILTVLGDALKAVIAVLLVRYLWHHEWAVAAAGIGVVLGHNWPVWLGFRGGAGGVVGGITLVTINPLAGLAVIPLAIANLYFTRYASIGTLNVGLGAVAVLLALWLEDPQQTPLAHVIYAIVMALAILWALRPNIERLHKKEERQITIW